MQGPEIIEPVRPSPKNNDPESGLGEIFLEFDSTISSQEHIEAGLRRQPEKAPILDATPTLRLNCSDIMTRKVNCQDSRELLVKQDSQRLQAQRPLLRGLRRPAPELRRESDPETYRGGHRLPDSRSDSGLALSYPGTQGYPPGFQDLG